LEDRTATPQGSLSKRNAFVREGGPPFLRVRGRERCFTNIPNCPGGDEGKGFRKGGSWGREGDVEKREENGEHPLNKGRNQFSSENRYN